MYMYIQCVYDIILGIRIRRLLPCVENKIENNYSPAVLETSKYTQGRVHCSVYVFVCTRGSTSVTEEMDTKRKWRN